MEQPEEDAEDALKSRVAMLREKLLQKRQESQGVAERNFLAEDSKRAALRTLAEEMARRADKLGHPPEVDLPRAEQGDELLDDFMTRSRVGLQQPEAREAASAKTGKPASDESNVFLLAERQAPSSDEADHSCDDETAPPKTVKAEDHKHPKRKRKKKQKEGKRVNKRKKPPKARNESTSGLSEGKKERTATAKRRRSSSDSERLQARRPQRRGKSKSVRRETPPRGVAAPKDLPRRRSSSRSSRKSHTKKKNGRRRIQSCHRTGRRSSDSRRSEASSHKHPGDFKPFNRVMLRGLQVNTELNGLCGVVAPNVLPQMGDLAGTYKVRLETAREVAVRPQNLDHLRRSLTPVRIQRLDLVEERLREGA